MRATGEGTRITWTPEQHEIRAQYMANDHARRWARHYGREMMVQASVKQTDRTAAPDQDLIFCTVFSASCEVFALYLRIVLYRLAAGGVTVPEWS